MLRVFRMKHIMRRHMEGAVVEAAGKLVFSLLSIVFIAAGLFFELEKYGVSGGGVGFCIWVEEGMCVQGCLLCVEDLGAWELGRGCSMSWKRTGGEWHARRCGA